MDCLIKFSCSSFSGLLRLFYKNHEYKLFNLFRHKLRSLILRETSYYQQKTILSSTKNMKLNILFGLFRSMKRANRSPCRIWRVMLLLRCLSTLQYIWTNVVKLSSPSLLNDNFALHLSLQSRTNADVEDVSFGVLSSTADNCTQEPGNISETNIWANERQLS